MHSLYRPGSYLTGDYWDGLPGAARSRPRRTRPRASRSSATPPARWRAPTATSSRRPQIDAVEIDAELTEIGRRYFDLHDPAPEPPHRGRAPLAAAAPTGDYDVIVVDAYRQPYIPFYLATREFFELARDRLAPGGRRDRQRRPPRGIDRARAGARADDGRGLPRPCSATRSRTTNTLLVGGEARRRAGVCARRPRGLPPRAAADRAASRRRDSGPPARGRRGLHRRPRPGRVADRPLDPRLRRQVIPADSLPDPAGRPEAERRQREARSMEKDVSRPGAPV